jgi:ribosomal protein S18 acetylase RimI-like enzyme
MKEALKDAAERGIIEVHVSTRTDNDIAIRLYKSLGFEYAGPLFEHNPCKESFPATR